MQISTTEGDQSDPLGSMLSNLAQVGRTRVPLGFWISFRLPFLGLDGMDSRDTRYDCCSQLKPMEESNADSNDIDRTTLGAETEPPRE